MSRKSDAEKPDPLARLEAALRAQAELMRAAADAIHDMRASQPGTTSPQTNRRQRPVRVVAPPPVTDDEPTPQERGLVRDKLRRLGVG